MQYIKQSQIDASPHVVFGFHERPDALQRLTPPWEKVRVVQSSGSIRPGSRVVLATRLGPFPLRWVAVHTEYDPPRLFADRQESGPFASWYHRHEFQDDGSGGTLMRDVVEYSLPLGPLGRLLLPHTVERKLEELFTYRHQVIRQLAEAGALEPLT